MHSANTDSHNTAKGGQEYRRNKMHRANYRGIWKKRDGVVGGCDEEKGKWKQTHEG
jgi:hypothetical protein